MKPLIENNQEKQIALFNAALTHEKAEVVILADVSSSMDSIIPATGKSRFDAMKNMLLRVVSSRALEPVGYQAAVIMFASNAQKLESFEHLNAGRYTLGGGTDLGKALRAAARLNPSHIVVITDGEPNSPHAAKETARTMLARLDVYYCGPGKPESVQFCKDIAQYGGEAVIDPSCLSMLETVQLFLTDAVIAA